MLARIHELLLARRSDRDELLRRLQAIAALLRESGVPEEVDAIAQELLQVARWWP